MKDILYLNLKDDLIKVFEELEIKSKILLADSAGKQYSKEQIAEIKRQLIKLQSEKTADAIEKYVNSKIIHSLQTKQTL